MTDKQEPLLPAAPRPSMASGAKIMGIIPTTVGEVYRIANGVVLAQWAPKSYKDNEGQFDLNKIALGIMQGMEVGLSPLAALQSIAVINGMPSIWGDGALALIYASGLMEDFQEIPILEKDDAGTTTVVGYTCKAKRRGIATYSTHTFTIQDAIKAGLSGKDTYKNYGPRMCQMRARSWTLRALFADVLKGLSFAEEAMDIIDMPQVQTLEPASRDDRRAKAKKALDAITAKPKPAEPESEIVTEAVEPGLHFEADQAFEIEPADQEYPEVDYGDVTPSYEENQ